MTKPGNSDRPEDTPPPEPAEQAQPAAGVTESADPAAAEPAREEQAVDPAPEVAEPVRPEVPDDGLKPATTPAKKRNPAAKNPPHRAAAVRAPTERARPPKKRPIMPTAAEAAADRGEKVTPKSVKWGFYLIVLAVLIGVFGGVFLLFNKETLVRNALEFEGGEPLTRAQAEASVTNGLWVFIVVNVLFGVLHVLAAYKAQEGVRRARMFVTIVTVLVVLFHYMLVPTLFGQLAGMVAAIATALLYMPATRLFYPPRATVR